MQSARGIAKLFAVLLPRIGQARRGKLQQKGKYHAKLQKTEG